MMNDSILFTRPDWPGELACKFGHYYTARLEDYAESKGFTVIDLETNDAVVEKVLEALKENPKGAYYFGHGDPQFLTGQRKKYIIKPNNYKDFAGPINHFLSCSFMKETGSKIPDSSGYFGTYYFMVNQQVPEKDQFAHWYFDSDQAYFKALMDGMTRKEAGEALIKAYTDAWEQIKNTYAGKWILWDRDHFKQVEDLNKRLTGEQNIVEIKLFCNFKGSMKEYSGDHWSLLGQMERVKDNEYSFEWNIEQEGAYKLKVIATDKDGLVKEKESNEFTVEFPETMEINFIYPKGGEVVKAKSIEVKIEAVYNE